MAGQREANVQTGITTTFDGICEFPLMLGEEQEYNVADQNHRFGVGLL